MHTRKFVLLIAAALLTCLGASAQTARLNHRYDMFKSIGTSDATLGTAFGTDFETTVFVGTSVVSQFPWEEAFYTDPEDASKRRVIDRGVWNATILDILNNIESIIALHPKKIFLMAGVNDGMDDAKNINVFIDNYRQVLHRLVNETNATIYVQSILPATADGRKLAVIRDANDSLQALTNETEFKGVRVSYIPLFDEVGDVSSSSLTPDSLHFSVIGYERWVNAIKTAMPGYHTFNENPTFELKSVKNVLGGYVFGGSKMAIGDLRNSFYANMPVNADDVLLIGGETICCGNWSELLGNYRVLNRGYGWDDANVRIDQVKESLPYILGYNYEKGNNHPKRIVLYIGLGDIASDDITLETAKDNYADLVHEIRTECPNTPITLVKLLNITPITGIADADIDEFNDAMLDLVKAEKHIDLIDLTDRKWTYVKEDASANETTVELSLYYKYVVNESSKVYFITENEPTVQYKVWPSKYAVGCVIDDEPTISTPTSVNDTEGWENQGTSIEIPDELGEDTELSLYRKDGKYKWFYVDAGKKNTYYYAANLVPATYSEGISLSDYNRTVNVEEIYYGESGTYVTLQKWEHKTSHEIILVEEIPGDPVDVCYKTDASGTRKDPEEIVNVTDSTSHGYYRHDIPETNKSYLYKNDAIEYWVRKNPAESNKYDIYAHNVALNTWYVAESGQTLDVNYVDQKRSEDKAISREYPTTSWTVTAPSFNVNNTAFTDGKHVFGPGYLCLADMLGELLHNIDELTVSVPYNTYDVVDARDVLASRVLVAETRAKAYTGQTKYTTLNNLATGGYDYLKGEHTESQLKAEAKSIFEATAAVEASSNVDNLTAGWYQIINIDAYTYNAGEGRVLAADNVVTTIGEQQHEAIFITDPTDIRSYIHIGNISGSSPSCTANLQLINGRYIVKGGASSETAQNIVVADDTDTYSGWNVLTLSGTDGNYFDLDRHEGKLLLTGNNSGKSYFKAFSVDDIVGNNYVVVNVVISDDAPDGTTITYNKPGYKGLPAYNGGYFLVDRDDITERELTKDDFSSIEEIDGVPYKLEYVYDAETGNRTVTLQPDIDFTAIDANLVAPTGWFQINVENDTEDATATNTQYRNICADGSGNVTFTLAKSAPTTYIHIEKGETTGKVFLRTIDGHYLKDDGKTVATKNTSACEFTITPKSANLDEKKFTLVGRDGSLKASKEGENVYLSYGTPAITFQACNVSDTDIREVTTTYTPAGEESAPDMSNILVTYNPEGGYLGLPVHPGGFIQLKGAFNAADFTLDNTPDGCICTVKEDGTHIVVNVRKITELTGEIELSNLNTGWYQMVLNTSVSHSLFSEITDKVLAFQLTPAVGADCGKLIADTKSPASYVKVTFDSEANTYTLRMPNGLYIGADGKGAAEAYNFTMSVQNVEHTTNIAVENDASEYLSVNSTEKVLCASDNYTYFNFYRADTPTLYTVGALPDGVEMITWAPAAGYTGSSVCAEGGVFFTDTAPAASEFNVTSSVVTAANGYADTSVDVNGTNVTVKLNKYPALLVAEQLVRNGFKTVEETADTVTVKEKLAACKTNLTANYEALETALGRLNPKTLLESGHAYRIKVANPAYGTSYGEGMAYLTSNNGALSTTPSVASDPNGKSIFACRKVGDKYLLVTHTGDYYMNYRSNSTENGTSKGYEDGNKLTIESLTGDYRHLLGLATINADDKYITLTNDPENPQWTSTGAPDVAEFGTQYTSAFIFEDVTETTDYAADINVQFNEVTMIKEEGDGAQYAFATKCLPYSFKLPDGMTAYYVPSASLTVDNEFKLRSIDYKDGAEHVVPANTAVILRIDIATLDSDISYKTNKNGHEVYTLLPAAEKAQILNIDDISSNVLKGTCVANTPVATVFDISKDVLGMRKLTDKSIVFAKMSTAAKNGILPKAKAFLGVKLPNFSSDESEARAMANAFMNISNWTLGAGVPTDIDEAESTTTDNSGIYDISGRKVESTAKGGFYIVRGKKVVIK